jgi:hypothetical protein
VLAWSLALPDHRKVNRCRGSEASRTTEMFSVG